VIAATGTAGPVAGFTTATSLNRYDVDAAGNTPHCFPHTGPPLGDASVITISSAVPNLVERFFKELTDRRLKRGVFTSVPDLIDAITTWIDHRNLDPKPFVWHAAADDIIKRVRRGRETLSQAETFTEH